jgi:plasmid stabilization system protein ParE
MKYRIDITAPAVADVEELHAFVSQVSVEFADRQLRLIEKAIEGLEEFPNRYALAPEAKTHKRVLRHLIVGHFRVLFMASLETVHILRVRHAAQAPLKPGELN